MKILWPHLEEFLKAAGLFLFRYTKRKRNSEGNKRARQQSHQYKYLNDSETGNVRERLAEVPKPQEAPHTPNFFKIEKGKREKIQGEKSAIL